MNEVRWGIIGCGDVTEVKSGPAFNKVIGSRLVAVMRRDAEKASDYAERHKVPKWYSDANELINDPGVNAVYVATPPNTHEFYTISALEAGKPVYVEKPMAMNTGECERMVEKSDEKGIPLFVAYYRRALPYFLKVKELVDSRIIGKVKLVNMQIHWPAKPGERDGNSGWRVNPEISGGGHFHDLASHQFDYLEFLLGPVKKAVGIGVNQSSLYPADDAISASFEFESGVIGSGLWCFTVPGDQENEFTEISGNKGRITFSFFSSNNIRVEVGDNVEEYEIAHPRHVQQPLIEQVVNDILGRGHCSSTGKTGMRATWIMDRILNG